MARWRFRVLPLIVFSGSALFHCFPPLPRRVLTGVVPFPTVRCVLNLITQLPCASPTLHFSPLCRPLHIRCGEFPAGGFSTAPISCLSAAVRVFFGAFLLIRSFPRPQVVARHFCPHS